MPQFNHCLEVRFRDLITLLSIWSLLWSQEMDLGSLRNTEVWVSFSFWKDICPRSNWQREQTNLGQTSWTQREQSLNTGQSLSSNKISSIIESKDSISFLEKKPVWCWEIMKEAKGLKGLQVMLYWYVIQYFLCLIEANKLQAAADESV